MAVTIEVTIDGIRYSAQGDCEFAGPYYESDGGQIHDCSPEVLPEHRREIEDAIEAAAYKVARAAQPARWRDEEDDWEPEERAPGPDYWYSEDGEPRCG